MMKKLLLFVLAAAFMAASCQMPGVGNKAPDRAVTLSWTVGKTILPSTYPNAASYDIELTAGDQVVEKNGVTDTFVVFPNLAKVEWDAHIVAKKANGEKIAEGWSTLDLTGTDKDFFVTLHYLFGEDQGTGIIDLTFDFLPLPKNEQGVVETVKSVKFVTYSPDGTHNEETPVVLLPSATNPTKARFFVPNAAVGNYFGYLRVETENFAATLQDSLLVIAGGETKTTILVTAWAKLLDYVGPQALWADRTDLRLKIGDRKRLQFLIAPENTTDRTVYLWSTNPEVATIDANGMVLAHQPGGGAIFAQSVDPNVFTVIPFEVDPLVPVSPLVADGLDYLRDGDYEAAYDTFALALNTNPYDTQAKVWKAFLTLGKVMTTPQARGFLKDTLGVSGYPAKLSDYVETKILKLKPSTPAPAPATFSSRSLVSDAEDAVASGWDLLPEIDTPVPGWDDEPQTFLDYAQDLQIALIASGKENLNAEVDALLLDTFGKDFDQALADLTDVQNDFTGADVNNILSSLAVKAEGVVGKSELLLIKAKLESLKALVQYLGSLDLNYPDSPTFAEMAQELQTEGTVTIDRAAFLDALAQTAHGKAIGTFLSEDAPALRNAARATMAAAVGDVAEAVANFEGQLLDKASQYRAKLKEILDPSRFENSIPLAVKILANLKEQLAKAQDSILFDQTVEVSSRLLNLDLAGIDPIALLSGADYAAGKTQAINLGGLFARNAFDPHLWFEKDGDGFRIEMQVTDPETDKILSQTLDFSDTNPKLSAYEVAGALMNAAGFAKGEVQLFLKVKPNLWTYLPNTVQPAKDLLVAFGPVVKIARDHGLLPVPAGTVSPPPAGYAPWQAVYFVGNDDEMGMWDINAAPGVTVWENASLTITANATTVEFKLVDGPSWTGKILDYHMIRTELFPSIPVYGVGDNIGFDSVPGTQYLINVDFFGGEYASTGRPLVSVTEVGAPE